MNDTMWALVDRTSNKIHRYDYNTNTLVCETNFIPGPISEVS